MLGKLACVVWACAPLAAQPLEISRPARLWEYMDAVGPRAAVLGNESGSVEAWVYPLKIVRNFHLQFRTGTRLIPGAAAARRIVSRPGVYSILFSGDDFQVTETFIAPLGQPGVAIRIEAETATPLTIEGAFERDFQLMWPASFGASYMAWDAGRHAYVFGADGAPYAAVFASPDLAPVSAEFATNYAAARQTTFSLGTVRGHGDRTIVIAGSTKSAGEAQAAADALLAAAPELAGQTEAFYKDYLDATLRLTLPDKALERAYDWARVSLRQGLVDNPMLGQGLVAGFGPSRDGYRPGFAWFFGRDTFWSSLALTAAGDFATARAAIRFIAKYQRDDGKLPHEISQAAGVVPWFRDFPYGYASADATPLFAIAVADYTEASGDTSLAGELWDRLKRALAFERATADPAGFPRNFEIGHGWVEGGPLLPVRTEFYQAGLYVESLGAMAALARLENEPDLARELASEAAAKKQKLHDLFWMPREGLYAFALGRDGKPVPRATVLATVPMWFGLTEPAASREMLGQLAGEDYSSDWGMRILSRRSDLYSPSGYHFGTVWPLFTGWAAMGEYRYHQAHAAFANLKANSWLTLDGPGGHTPEVFSGQTCSPLSTGSPHQTWSAAMVIAPLVRGLLGLRVDRVAKRVDFEPHLPADWDQVSADGPGLSLALRRNDRQLTLEFSTGGAELRFAPAFAPVTQLMSADLTGSPVSWTREEGGSDWHAVFVIPAGEGKRTLTLRYRNSFGIAVPAPPPRLAESSRNLKLIAEEWKGREVTLTVSGIPGRSYRLDLHGDARVAAVVDAALLADAHSIRVTIPGEGADYRNHSVRIQFAEPAPVKR